MARYFVTRDFKLDPVKETGQLLFWYVHNFLWGRYAGSTETILNRDLNLIQQPDGSLDHLIGGLRISRGDLRVHAADFVGWSQGARFYPLMHMLTRVCDARDWGTGLALKAITLNRMARLELHHIFPKALLYKHGYARADVNALANFTFQTKQTNLALSDQDPAHYLPRVEKQFPGALASHWVPSDVSFWRIERYHDFLDARRERLASAANAFLENLYGGPVPTISSSAPNTASTPVPLPGGFADPEEEALLREVNEWAKAFGLPTGELAYELCDAETGAAIAVFDLAWPSGLQQGLSQPVALLIDEDDKVHEAANQAGFLFFTDVDSFRRYASERLAA